MSGAFVNCSATESLLSLGSPPNGEGDLAPVLHRFPARPSDRSFVFERGSYVHPPVSGVLPALGTTPVTGERTQTTLRGRPRTRPLPDPTGPKLGPARPRGRPRLFS